MEYLALIKSNKLFENSAVEKINFEELNLIYEYFEAGKIIYKKQTPAEFLFLLLEGNVVLVSSFGKKHLKEEDFFGTAIIEKETFGEIAVAETDVFLLKIDKNVLESLINSDKQIKKNILSNKFDEKTIFDEEVEEKEKTECPPCPEKECPEQTETNLPTNILTYEEVADKIVSAFYTKANRALEIITEIEKREGGESLLELEENVRKIFDTVNLAFLFNVHDDNLDKKTHSVRDLLNEFIEHFSVDYSFFKCKIEVKESENYSVSVNRKKLYEAVKQILLNSCESTEFAGEIFVEISLDKNYVEIKFTDNGKGIPPERSLDVFEPFVSFEKSSLGLGLSVADKIIREHSGKITVKQKNTEGASISIYLPVVNEA